MFINYVKSCLTKLLSLIGLRRPVNRILSHPLIDTAISHMKNGMLASVLQPLSPPPPPPATHAENLNKQPSLIVSFTSYKERLSHPYEVGVMIYSLFLQKKRPDRIILWIAASDYPKGIQQLPKEIRDFMPLGLEVQFVREDLGPYTKLVYALSAYPEDIIITVDDDVYYYENQIENLWNSYLKYPRFIHGSHIINWTILCGKDGNDLPYDLTLSGETSPDAPPSYHHMVAGVEGILYPPHTLYKDVLRSELYMKLVPTVDDHWFYAQAVLQGTKMCFVSANEQQRYLDIIAERPTNPHFGTSLYHQNRGLSYQRLKILMDYYPEFKRRMLSPE